MKRVLLLTILCFGLTHLLTAQWMSINPGAGGQVQDIVCDPNQADRLLLASDMEGIYESLDNGISWHPFGDLMHNRVYSIAIKPGNSDHIFAGTLYGLEVSLDRGLTFQLVESTRRKSVGVISVSPLNPELVLAGIGWRDDYDFTDHFALDQKGKGELYRSSDGGLTWSVVYFDQDLTGDRNVFSIEFDSNNPDRIYLGSAKGVYMSNDSGLTWNKIPPPEGTKLNFGVDVSPDGKALYAVYSIEGRKRNIYATSTSQIDWTPITQGDGIALGIKDYWYPEVDSRSKDGEHILTIALQGGRDGLFESRIKWKNGRIDSYAWNTVWSGVGGFDPGWDNAHPNPRLVHYTPKSWKRAIWSTTNQTIFEGVPCPSGYEWKNRYSIPNYNYQIYHWETYWPTYSSRGTESTYTYDLTTHENYFLQGQGDNGFVESWDYGRSWSNIQHRRAPMNLSDVQAVDVAITKEDKAVAIAQATGGYGGFAVDGRLYVKELETHTPEDQWLFLAGGPEEEGGLGNGVIRDLAVSPVMKDRVFLFSTGKGMYLMDNLGDQIRRVREGKQATCIRISNGVLEKVHSVKKISPHPFDPDVVFLNGTGGDQGVYRGEQIEGSWTWEKVLKGSGWDAEVVSWGHKGQVFLFYSGVSEETGGDGNSFIGALSMDEGKTWKTVINRKTAVETRHNPWLEQLGEDFRFVNKGGAAGFEDQLIMSYYDHKMQKVYGVFKGKIDSKGNVAWEDWTANLPFGGLTSTICRIIDGQPYILVSTAGAGAWMRPLYKPAKDNDED